MLYCGDEKCSGDEDGEDCLHHLPRHHHCATTLHLILFIILIWLLTEYIALLLVTGLYYTARVHGVQMLDICIISHLTVKNSV